MIIRIRPYESYFYLHNSPSLYPKYLTIARILQSIWSEAEAKRKDHPP